jgi:hypothetical protein
MKRLFLHPTDETVQDKKTNQTLYFFFKQKNKFKVNKRTEGQFSEEKKNIVPSSAQDKSDSTLKKINA